MKVLVILGTRPEVIKLAPVILKLVSHADVCVCATGQHQELLQQALVAFDLKPDIMLDTMSPGRSLNILSARLIEAIDFVLEQERPDWVLVQGDTTTAFCAGLASFHRGIKIGHVEAGLRTFDLNNPFPEEANRSMLARIVSLHFAPTNLAARALHSEGVDSKQISVTGNTVIDAIQIAIASWPNGVPSDISAEILAKVKTSPIVLVTCHRRENFGSVIEDFCLMLARLCIRHSDLQWIFPVHLNPSVREPVSRLLNGLPNLYLTDPVDYHTNLYLIQNARLVLSDSGGIQEEAPTFGTPVVVMRQFTERMEGVHAGFATLAGQNTKFIEESVDAWLGDEARRASLRYQINPYGDGKASERIVAALLNKPSEPFYG